MRQLAFVLFFLLSAILSMRAEARCFFHWGSAESNRAIEATLSDGQMSERSVQFFRNDYLPEAKYLAGAGLYLSSSSFDTVTYGDDLLIACTDDVSSIAFLAETELKKMSDTPGREYKQSDGGQIVKYLIQDYFISWYVLPRAWQPGDAKLSIARMATSIGQKFLASALREEGFRSLFEAAWVSLPSKSKKPTSAQKALTIVLLSELKNRLAVNGLPRVLAAVMNPKQMSYHSLHQFLSGVGLLKTNDGSASPSEVFDLLMSVPQIGARTVAAVVAHQKLYPQDVGNESALEYLRKTCATKFTAQCAVASMYLSVFEIDARELEYSLQKYLISNFKEASEAIPRHLLALSILSWEKNKTSEKISSQLMPHFLKLDQVLNAHAVHEESTHLSLLNEIYELHHSGRSDLAQRIMDIVYPLKDSEVYFEGFMKAFNLLDSSRQTLFLPRILHLLDTFSVPDFMKCKNLDCLWKLSQSEQREAKQLRAIADLFRMYKERREFRFLPSDKLGLLNYALFMTWSFDYSTLSAFLARWWGREVQMTRGDLDEMIAQLSLTLKLKMPIDSSNSCSAIF